MLRLEATLDYHSDRPIVVALQTRGHDAGRKPLEAPVKVDPQVRNLTTREVVISRTVIVDAGVQTLITLGQTPIGSYEVLGIGHQVGSSSRQIIQDLQVCPPPLRYAAAWFAGEHFHVVPIDDPVNLTINEWVDHGTRLELTRTLQLDATDSPRATLWYAPVVVLRHSPISPSAGIWTSTRIGSRPDSRGPVEEGSRGGRPRRDGRRMG